jgi:L-malate glycosyltransferase
VLRVLQVVLSLNPGGTERLVVELARRLDGRVATAICCLDEAGAWGQEVAAAGIPVTALGRQPGFQPRLGLRVAEAASRHRADVVHCHHYSPFVYACVSQLRYGGARLVFTEHGRLADAPPSPKRRAANALLARLPDRVFTVSDDLRQHLVREGFPPVRVEVIYNGIDLLAPAEADARAAARAAFGFAPGDLVLVTVARLDPVKDLGTLLRAVAHVREAVPRARLLVVGDGDERRPLEEMTAALDLQRHVVFAGHRNDARALLAGADVYVNSSIFEGVSLTILEAMAAPLPVVATAVGGTPEVVTAETGVLVPARDPATLAAAIERLARDAHLRAAMATSGRSRVEERFTLDRMVDDYHDVYAGAR